MTELTVSLVHRAFLDGKTTAEELTQLYLDRIEKHGRALNAITFVNPDAPETARKLDERMRESGLTGPLHGIPVIVKDNFNTVGIPTTGGSAALRDCVPPYDAFQVRRLKEAGAIVLAKSNMGEFAFDPLRTVSTVLDGPTRNPYDTGRVPAGSSGGTAAAVAADLGLVGMGTDTGNSIRGPSSHCCLVGIRSTMGLTSRAGIVPNNLDRDIGGPMCRTVADAVTVFDVVAGYDPDDPATETCRTRRAGDYTKNLNRTGLRGKRIGVFREIFMKDTLDRGIGALMEQAIVNLQAEGAVVVDPVDIPEYREGPFWYNRFAADLEDYLATLGDAARYRTVQEILDSGLAKVAEKELRDSLGQPRPDDDPGRKKVEEKAEQLRQKVLATMERSGVDFLIYPTWSNPPRRIDDNESPHGNNSPQLSPHTGFPAVTVPMGFTSEGLPGGLQILGRAWSEPSIFEVAYGYEQATLHRRPPKDFPPLLL
jgi:Asp-tRNA(Asn)/Glu-tRNA(Gln) amidotransferase A subunit family amidase